MIVRGLEIAWGRGKPIALRTAARIFMIGMTPQHMATFSPLNLRHPSIDVDSMGLRGHDAALDYVELVDEVA